MEAKSILICNVKHGNETVDVYIADGQFKAIGPKLNCSAATVIDGSNRAILPPFYNAHAHSPMSLFRSYADDLELFSWLSDYIWPAEATLTEEDMYNGTRLCILEMIKSGTIFFNDMYWYAPSSIRAIDEMHMRACVGMVLLDRNPDREFVARIDASNRKLLNDRAQLPRGISLSYAPHAVYTINDDTFVRVAREAQALNIPIHVHVSETAREVADCTAEHGCSPVRHLANLGVFDGPCIAAHCVHLSDDDLAILVEKGVYCVWNPCSNMKLCSGAFPYERARRAGARILLGTDGAGSNNNVSMLEEMKFAALLAKHESGDPKACPAHDIFKIATQNGAEAFGISGGGIAEGKAADCMLVDLQNPLLMGYDLTANMVYSADSSCIQTLICNGHILMRDRFVAEEQSILKGAQKSLEKLFALRKK